MNPYITAGTPMKLIFILTLALLPILLLLTHPTTRVHAQEDTPHFPTVLTGTTLLDGHTAPNGTILKATIDGNIVATTTMADGRYTLRVPPHPTTDYTGMTITFTVNDFHAAQTTQWHSDGGGNLDLTARTPLPTALKRSVMGVTNVLVDQYGLSLYTLAQDSQETSSTPTHISCDPPECQGSWKPFTINDTDTIATTGVPEHLVGKVTQPNGRAQVTYNGWPLYRFTGDQATGQANGQGLNNTWWLISPNAQIIQGAGSPGSAGPPGQDGQKGDNGLDGQDGKDGKKGLNGATGPKGTNGKNGYDAIDGIDGTNGQDGIDGQNGQDGKTGLPGPQGIPGAQGLPGPQSAPSTPTGPTTGASNTMTIIVAIIATLSLAVSGYAIYLTKGANFLSFIKRS